MHFSDGVERAKRIYLPWIAGHYRASPLDIQFYEFLLVPLY